MEQPTLIQQPDIEPSPPAPTSDRDIQRAALRDLVALATECAATENEIERRYKTEVESENGRSERLLRDIARKSSNLREMATQVREQAIAQANTTYQTSVNTLNTRDEEFRRKISDKHAMTIAEVKRKYEQAVWLAESVLENEQNGAAVDFKTAKDLVEAHGEALEGLETKASGGSGHLRRDDCQAR